MHLFFQDETKQIHYPCQTVYSHQCNFVAIYLCAQEHFHCLIQLRSFKYCDRLVQNLCTGCFEILAIITILKPGSIQYRSQQMNADLSSHCTIFSFIYKREEFHRWTEWKEVCIANFRILGDPILGLEVRPFYTNTHGVASSQTQIALQSPTRPKSYMV